MLRAGGRDTAQALLLMVVELARLMDTIRQVHAAQDQSHRAGELQRHVHTLQGALDDARNGRNGPWDLTST